MKLRRRDFLGILAGAGAGIGLSKLPLRRLVGLNDLVVHKSQPGVQSWIRTSCQICSGGCGMEVRLVDGQPVGVRGNPLHPISRGGLCPVGAESMHFLYSPDRIRSPLKAASESRPYQDWKGIGWDEALDELAERIRQLRLQGKADRIYLIDGNGRGLMSKLAMEFMNVVGSPNYFMEQTSDPIKVAMNMAQGVLQAPAYDLENAATILSFGVPLLEGWESPVHGNRAVGAIRKASAEDRSRRLIQLDVHTSRTSDRADQFAKIKPGSFGAAALAIAYVLISQKLYDRDFVEAYTSGFEDWKDENGKEHLGFKNYVLQYCRPQDLEATTGIASRDLLKIAKDFATKGPSVAIVEGAATSMSNGVQTAFAVQALNALVGSMETAGGAMIADPVPFRIFPGNETEQPISAEPEGFRRKDFRDVEDLLKQLQEKGEGMEILFLLNADPFASIPQGKRFEAAIGDATLISFSPLPDQTTQMADLVLPDVTFLERWQDCIGPNSHPNATLGITQPVIEPLYNARPSGDVLLDLANRINGESPASLPWSNFKDLLKHAALGAFDAHRGSPFSSEREAAEIREMEQRGWWIPVDDNEDGFWQELLATGGWWDPYYQTRMWPRVFQTPDRRFNFFALPLHRQVSKGDPLEHEVVERLRAYGISEPGDPAFLPHLQAPVWLGEKGDDSLHMHLMHPIIPSTAVASSLPWVREAMNDKVPWDAWVDMHEDDGHRLGIANGEMVEVASGDSSFQARVLLSHSTQPGLISVPRGVGRSGGGRWASKRGANPNTVLAPDVEIMSGCFQFQGNKVKIVKINSGESHV
ncbi:MAG: molybdopterin-dependent oxidoreductase [Planctomycetes bacterium]|nr:molybdopterin-dependent oxidoreductase [Planctomycetota bacterium]